MLTQELLEDSDFKGAVKGGQQPRVPPEEWACSAWESRSRGAVPVAMLSVQQAVLGGNSTGDVWALSVRQASDAEGKV